MGNVRDNSNPPYVACARNAGADVCRVLFMFCICTLHAVTQCGHPDRVIASALHPCVCGFLFISGWFGITFSVRKILKLIGIAMYASAVIVLIDCCANHSCADAYFRFFRIVTGNWFLNSYLMLMLVAPILNYATERIKVHDILLPFMLLVLWNWASELPLVNRIVPKVPGLGAYTPLTFVILYCTSRLIRKFGVPVWMSPFRMITLGLAMVVVCSIIPWVNLLSYSSPIAIICASLVVLPFLMTEPYVGLTRICAMLSGSMFTVFFLHGNDIGCGMLASVQERLIDGFGRHCSYLLTGGLAFLVGVVADIPTRARISSATVPDFAIAREGFLSGLQRGS